MPYIPQAARAHLADGWVASTPGDLNYQFTKLIAEYWHSTPSYRTINDIVGALEGAKLEFYRRIVVPYENAKLAENGDVYL